MYQLLSPDNQIVKFSCVKDFIKEHNFTTRIFGLLNGTQDQYKGWRRVEDYINRDVEDQLRFLLLKTFSKAKRRLVSSQGEFLALLDKKYPNVSLIEQIFLFERNMLSPPMCAICGGPVFFHSEKRGYYDTCSKRCMNGLRHGFTKDKIDAIRKTFDNRDVLSVLMIDNDQKTIAKEMGLSQTMVGDYVRKYNIVDGYSSNLERSVSAWIKTLPFKFNKDRKVLGNGQEIDFYCEEMNFGLEANGLYRHTEISGKKSIIYHKEKLDLATNKGIRLISFFEDEWYDRSQAVQNIIKTQLGIQKIGVGARSITIDTVVKRDAKKFLESYHVQGSCNIGKVVGAYFSEQLVAVMVFGTPTRQSKSNYQYELKRYCTDGKIYPGLTSKLFKHFVKTHHPHSIVSFCDKRFFVGRSYTHMGFRLDGEVSPNFSYTNDYRTRHYKSKFKLKNIQKLLDPTVSVYSKTADEWMKQLGYDRIWDCGKLRFVWNNR